MSAAKQPVSTTQFISVITGLQASVVFLALPSNLASAAGTDGWLAIPIGWMVSTVAAVVIVRVMSYYPQGTILDLLQHFAGGWASRLAALMLAFYYFIFAYDGLIITLLVTKEWLLPNTSVFILAVLFLAPGIMIAQKGLQVISRYALIIVIMSIWIPFVYLFTLHDAVWLNLLPMLKEGWGPVFSAVRVMLYPALGLTAVFFIYPHLTNKAAAASAIVIANSLSHGLYLFITFVCFVYFSPNEIDQFMTPVIYIMKSLEFNFIERVEVPFIAFYLLIFSLDSIPSMYFVSFCLKRMINKGSIGVYLGVFCAAVLTVMLVRSPSVGHIDDLNFIMALTGILVEYILPVCLLLFLVIRNKGKKAS
jgi:spore germination protein (amino acid permease)